MTRLGLIVTGILVMVCMTMVCCDNPGEPTDSKFVEKPKKPKVHKPVQTTSYKRTYTSKAELTELYWYIIETHQKVEELAANMEQAKQQGPHELSAAQAQYRSKVNQWNRTIPIRMEVFRVNKIKLPSDHPRSLMYRALYMLDELIKDFGNHYFSNWDLHPEINQQLKQILEQGKIAIDKMEN